MLIYYNTTSSAIIFYLLYFHAILVTMRTLNLNFADIF